MKKIAFYIGDLGMGGAERVMTNLADYFDEEGYEVIMVTKLKEKKEYPLNPGIKRILADITPEEETGSRIRNLFARIGKLRRIWKEEKPDIIVSFIRKNNLMAIASSRFLNIPVVVSVRSAPERELKGRLFKPLSLFMFRFADGIVLQTKGAYEFFPNYLRKKSEILPNSINPAFMEATTDLTRTSADKRVIAVGRIDDNKNQKMLWRSFAEIAGDHPDWTLHLYGDGEGSESLKKEVSGTELASRVFFHGKVDNVPEAMINADIFVLPSRMEGMPNALIEAMTLGLACISTDCPCGGPADIIRNGNNGILIPVDDGEALNNALTELMENESRREELGREAKAIGSELAPQKVNRRWKEYLYGICSV